MDRNVREGLRELMKPMANAPIEEAPSSGLFDNPRDEAILREKLQSFARRFLAETARP
jgi:hypothetical protein